jgi:hypothetical protein
VPDDGERILSKVIGQPDNIRREPIQIVTAHTLWFVADVIAALIWGDHSEPAIGQERDLVPPAVPKLGKSMQKEYDRALNWTGLGDVELDAIGCNSREAHDICDVGHEMLQG